MSAKETQSRILSTAVALFNAHGTANVYPSQIAAECGISKGHLHYHYKSKDELILSIVWKIIKEIETNWYRDDDDLAPEHLAHMFVRHIELNYRYRFFFRELPSLLRSNELVKRRFVEARRKRVRAYEAYLDRSEKAGHTRPIRNNQDLQDSVTATWVFADNWMNYVEATGETVDEASIRVGYRIMKSLLRPQLTRAAYDLLPEPESLSISLVNIQANAESV